MLRSSIIRNSSRVAFQASPFAAVRSKSSAAGAQVKVSEPKAEKAMKAPRETNSFALGMFQGVTNMSEVFPYPDYLTEEEKSETRELMDPAAKFLNEVNDAAVNDALETVPEEIMEQAKELGVMGALVSPDYGGLGLKNTQYAKLTEIAGAADLGFGIVMGAHQSIGYKGIYLFGNEQQKKKYLPDLCSGKRMACFCLTEPSSGSDAASIKTRAVKSDDGKHYILNGGKLWISNGGFAEIFTVFAQTPVKDPNTGEVKEKVSAFIVERQFGGVTNGPPEKKMGIKASNTAEVNFDNVKIPVENLLGAEGEGFKIAMNILNNGRFGLASSMAGTIKHVIGKASEWAGNRVQFKKKISEFGVIQEKIAKMSVDHYVAESMAYVIANNMDKGITEFQIEAAIAKVFCSEAAWKATDETIQVMGGMGYMKDAGVERVLRDLRIFRIFEGTNDILRLFIALTGIQHAASHLQSVQKGGLNAKLMFGSQSLMKKAGFGNLNSVIGEVHEDVKDGGRLLAECMGHFSDGVNSLVMKYKKNIMHEQIILSRLADAAIDIYGMAVVLSRCSDSLSKNLPSKELETKYTTLFCNEASQRVALNLKDIKSNSRTANNELVKEISAAVISNGGVAHAGPLGF